MTEEVKTEEQQATPAAPQQQYRMFRVGIVLNNGKNLSFQLGKDGCNMIVETQTGYLIGFRDGSGVVVPLTAIAFSEFAAITLEKALEVLAQATTPEPKFEGDNVVSFAEASKKTKSRK